MYTRESCNSHLHAIIDDNCWRNHRRRCRCYFKIKAGIDIALTYATVSFLLGTVLALWDFHHWLSTSSIDHDFESHPIASSFENPNEARGLAYDFAIGDCTFPRNVPRLWRSPDVIDMFVRLTTTVGVG